VAEPQQADALTEKTGRGPKFWVAIVAVVLLAIFVIQNSQRVEVTFRVFTTTETPLVLALLITGVLGAIIGWAAPRIRRSERD
jgi:uncharacterized integral membrane protein